MNSKPTPEHLQEFVAHIVATLPDSLRLRKVVLVTALRLLPRNFAQRDQLRLLLEHLNTHDQAQLEFELKP